MWKSMKPRMRWSLAARGAALLLAGAAVGCGGSPGHTEPVPAVQEASAAPAPTAQAPPATQPAPAPDVRTAPAAQAAPAGAAVREPDPSATTEDLAGAPAVAVFPSASSRDSSPRGGRFLDSQTGPTAPTEGPSLAASEQGAEYTWKDGGVTRRMRLQLDLVAQPTSENRDDDVVAVDQGERSIVRKQERHEQDTSEPVFRTESGHLVTFPGGMLIMLDGAWDAAQVQSFFTNHGIDMSRVEGQTFGPNAFLVSTESGFAALELANDFWRPRKGVVYAVPDQLLGAVEE